MSFPHLAEHMIHEGIDPIVQKHILQYDQMPLPKQINYNKKEIDGANNPVLQQSMQCVQRNILTEMDARDFLRVRQMEQVCQVRAYTVSQERGATYDATRHLHANFNRTPSFMYQLAKLLRQSSQHDDDNNNNNDNDDRRNRNAQHKSTATSISSASTALSFRQIILDYYWIPKGTWCMEHWSKEFFSKTLPALVQANMLQYECPHVRHAQHAHQAPRSYNRKKPATTATTIGTTREGGGGGEDDRKMPATITNKDKTAATSNATSTTTTNTVSVRKQVHYETDLGTGVVYLPFCYHVCKELVAALTILSRYYDISFLQGSQLSEHALWRSTQDLPPDIMQRVFGKQLNQEDLYCTFGPRDVFECMEDTRVGKVQVIEVLSRIEDFEGVRMIKLQALRPNHQNQPGRGGFVGLAPHAQCVQRGFLHLMGLDDSSFSLTAMTALNQSQKHKKTVVVSTERFLQQCLGKGGRFRRRTIAPAPAPVAPATTTTTLVVNKRGPGRPPRLAQQERQKRKRAIQSKQNPKDDSYHFIFGPVKNLRTYLRITKDKKKEKKEEKDDDDDASGPEKSDEDDNNVEAAADDDDESDEDDDDFIQLHERECMCAGCSDENRQIAWVGVLLFGTKYQKFVQDKHMEVVHDELILQANAAKEQQLAYRKKGAYKRKSKKRKLDEPSPEIDDAWMNHSQGTIC